MSVDGTWNITMKTAMGNQNGVLELASEGTTLTGQLKSPMASVDLSNGKIAGDQLSWVAHVTSPVPLTMEFTATVSGDTINGEATLGAFGSATLAGTRAA